MRQFVAGFLAILLFPYVVTLAVSGEIGGASGAPWTKQEVYSGKRIYLDRQQKGYVDVEEYLVGVVARQIPASYEEEAIKAQAIIARTCLYRQMKGREEIKESELDLEALKETQMEAMWGNDNFVEYYGKIEKAVSETRGKAICRDGQYIEPLFHRASAGYTRDGGSAYPYLVSVDSRGDVEAEGFLTVLEWTPEEFAQQINAISGQESADAGQLEETLQLIEKDPAGYVLKIQIGAHTFSGDQVRMALSLPSDAFVFKFHEGKIQAVCSGIGHGYGVSQFGAERMAREGMTAEEILNYYYDNITINFEEL